jgi:hypothetical protein
MRKSRFTEEQIIKVLKEHAAGLSAGEVCHRSSVLQPKVLPFDPAELAEPVDKRFHIGLGERLSGVAVHRTATRRVGCAFAASGPTATTPKPSMKSRRLMLALRPSTAIVASLSSPLKGALVHVRFGPLADIPQCPGMSAFPPIADISLTRECTVKKKPPDAGGYATWRSGSVCQRQRCTNICLHHEHDVPENVCLGASSWKRSFYGY